MRVRIVYLLVMMLIFLSSCGNASTGSTGQQPTTAAQPPAPSIVASASGVAAAPSSDEGANLPPCPDIQPISGPIVFGYGNNIQAMKESVGEPQQLTKIPDTWWAHEPAWSPDGQTLAYSLDRPASDPQLDWLPVGVICAADRETGKGRVLARGKVETDSFSEVSWTPDGKALLIVLHRRLLDDKKQYLGDKTMIVRFDIATSDYQTLIDNAISPALSPDGKHLAYINLDDTAGNTPVMVAQADGKEARPLLPNNAQVGTAYTPRWSPDGSQITFTATSGTIPTSKAPKIPGRDSPLRAFFDRLTGVSVAEAHGLPAFLYIVGADGKGLHRLSEKGLDDPRAAWSPDGKRLAFLSGTFGVTLVDLASGKEQHITDQGNFGGISWASK